MKRVLVLDADQRSALAVTRSLGRRGIPVYTADAGTDSLAGCSRYSRRYFPCPSPEQHPEQYVAALVRLARDQDIDILLPMTELTTTLVLDHQARFPGIVIPFPDPANLDAMIDKCSLMRMAAGLGVPVPRTWHADSPTTLPCSLDALPYPLVIKPGRSWLLEGGHWKRAAVRIAGNPAEAAGILDSEPALRAHPFMFQEHIAGHGQGVFALYDKGEALTFFAHRRLREKPPRGGVSVLSESVAVEPAAGAYARTLLDAAGWHGIAMVEFKVSADGTPYLMEINTRFWGSLQLAVDAGVDFPWLLYQLASGMRPERLPAYRTGNRLRWLLGDLDSLYLTLRDRDYRLGRKAAAIVGFLTPAPFRTRHETDRWGDMGPFRYELRRYLADLLR